MKETFDELIVMLDEMKRAAIHACDYYSARNYQRITSKVVVLQAKYNEGLQKEPVAAKNTEMTALEYCLKGGTKMDAVKFLKERKRMCDSYPIICGKCKISEAKDGLHCYEFQYTFPERDVAIDQLHSYGVKFGEKAELQKVRHGHWIMNKDYVDGKIAFVHYCSECDKSAYWQYKFCPECGAKMDGRVERGI